MTCCWPFVKVNGSEAMKSSFSRVEEHAVALVLRDASRDATSAVWQINASSYRNVCKALSKFLRSTGS